MTLAHATALRNTWVDALTTALGSTAKIKFRVGGTLGSPGTAAATLAMANPAFGASSSGVGTAGTITNDSAATGNASPVTKASLETGGGSVQVYCDVGTSGQDINLTGVTIANGDSVGISSLTYTAAP